MMSYPKLRTRAMLKLIPFDVEGIDAAHKLVILAS